jgi:hypothetical protein
MILQNTKINELNELFEAKLEELGGQGFEIDAGEAVLSSVFGDDWDYISKDDQTKQYRTQHGDVNLWYDGGDPGFDDQFLS